MSSGSSTGTITGPNVADDVLDVCCRESVAIPKFTVRSNLACSGPCGHSALIVNLRMDIINNSRVAETLLHNAAALILLHNHPPGDPHMSRRDVQFTQRLLSDTYELPLEIRKNSVFL